MKTAIFATALAAAVACSPAQAGDREIGAAIIGGLIGYSIAQNQNSAPVYGGHYPSSPQVVLPPIVLNFPQERSHRHRHGAHVYHGTRGACEAYRVPVYRHGRIVEYIQHCR